MSPVMSMVSHVPAATWLEEAIVHVAGLEDVAAEVISQLPPGIAVPNVQVGDALAVVFGNTG